MMREIDAPFLELSFYFAHLSEEEALTRLISTLIMLGAKFTGTGYVHRSTGIRDTRFAAITDNLLEPIILEKNADLTQHLSDPNIRLIQIYMSGATDTLQDKAEIVTYVNISSEAALVDHHPLAIWTEGELFSGTFRRQHAKRARKIGQQIYRRFRILIETLQPSYAAITTEWNLECPADLQRDSRSLAFRDFFVSGAYLGASKLALVQNMFVDAYIEPVGDGIYVSCMEELNPIGKSLDTHRATELSSKVAKLIAAIAQSQK